MAQDPKTAPTTSEEKPAAEVKYTSSRQFLRERPDLPVLGKIINAPTMVPPNGGHYCVLCNLPHGLICEVDGMRIKLKGAAHFLMPNKNRKFVGQLPQEAIFGATTNFVDKDFWDKFIAKVTDKSKYPEGYGPIVNGQVIWNQRQSEATLIRKETMNMKSGFEQVDPETYGVKKDNDAPGTSAVIPRVTE